MQPSKWAYFVQDLLLTLSVQEQLGTLAVVEVELPSMIKHMFIQQLKAIEESIVGINGKCISIFSRIMLPYPF